MNCLRSWIAEMATIEPSSLILTGDEVLVSGEDHDHHQGAGERDVDQAQDAEDRLRLGHGEGVRREMEELLHELDEQQDHGDGEPDEERRQQPPARDKEALQGRLDRNLLLGHRCISPGELSARREMYGTRLSRAARRSPGLVLNLPGCHPGRSEAQSRDPGQQAT
jgi:hypothetical protein